jgi:hypothetical protein
MSLPPSLRSGGAPHSLCKLTRPTRRLSLAAHDPSAALTRHDNAGPPPRASVAIRQSSATRAATQSTVMLSDAYRNASCSACGAFPIGEQPIAPAFEHRANLLGKPARLEHPQGPINGEVVAELFESLLYGYESGREFGSLGSKALTCVPIYLLFGVGPQLFDRDRCILGQPTRHREKPRATPSLVRPPGAGPYERLAAADLGKYIETMAGNETGHCRNARLNPSHAFHHAGRLPNF